MRMFVTCASAALLGGVSGCSFHMSVGSKTVNKNDVINAIKDKMTDAQGNKPQSVTCPGELEGKVGATMKCAMQSNGQTIGVLVTVTSVDGDRAQYEMVKTLDKATLAQDLSKDIEPQLGHAPEKVTCPDDLQGKMGTTLHCEMTENGQVYDITVTVSSVDGSDLLFDYKVADQPKS